MTAKFFSFRTSNSLQIINQKSKKLLKYMGDAKKPGFKPDNTATSTVDSESSEDENASGTSIELIQKFFSDKLNLQKKVDDDKSTKKVIENLNLDGLINHWKSGGIKNVITMVGAGVSTSAGIPDFRSPGAGLYDNLSKYKLPYPEAIFELKYFRDNPKPFFALAKELYPGTFKPTLSHYFVKLLSDKGLLVRHYTQNIDTLERIAKIPDDKLVEAHGTFFTNHCIKCRKEYSMQWAKEEIFKDKIPSCEICNDIVKPDIVFFGENLPDKFYELPSVDFKNCDLLIIMGTSLEVQPFASLIDRVSKHCLRLLINRDKVGKSKLHQLFSRLSYNEKINVRDIALIGDCDEGVYALAKGLGWEDELKELVKKEHETIDNENSKHEKIDNESSKHQKKDNEISKHQKIDYENSKQKDKTKSTDEEKVTGKSNDE